MELLEQIREKLARLAQLTKEELEELRTQIVDCFDQFDGEPDSADVVAIQNELVEAGDNVMARQGEIVAEEQANAEAREAARNRMKSVKGETDEENEAGDGASDPQVPADGTTEGDGASGESTDAEQPAAVAASGKAPVQNRSLSSWNRPTQPRNPEAVEVQPQRPSLIAAGNTFGAPAGHIFEDRYDLARSFSDQLSRMNKTDRGGRVLIASARWDHLYPDERRIANNNEIDATAKIAAVCSPQALVATGGICAPVNVDYSMPTFATAERPLRDGLPAFQASRGGIIFRQPPSLASLSSATGLWSEATDADPGDATKPVQQIACPSTETVYVEAVSTRIGFGNMMSMFDPETVATNTDLAIAYAARVAENNLLALLHGVSLTNLEFAKNLGAVRDLLWWLDVAAANYRTANRIPRTTGLTIVLPDWIKDLIRADRVRELAHDATSSIDPLAISDEYIQSLFAARNLHPIFHLDGQTEDSETQTFTAPTASSAFPSFPANVIMWLYVEGSIQFLDAGRLDLGVVRDSTLDATNDYETFVETFEGLAFRGFSNGCWELNANLCANGGSAGSVATSGLTC